MILTTPDRFTQTVLGACLLVIYTTQLHAGQEGALRAYTTGDYKLAYQYFLQQAKKGEPCAQNLIGFMLFNGKGMARDTIAALKWFEKAAQGGSLEAQVNLVVIYATGAQGIAPDRLKTQTWIDQMTAEYARHKRHQSVTNEKMVRGVISCPIAPVLRIDAVFEHDGKSTFLVFCAGCHGFDGFASYPTAPSFSMGERLEKDDVELMKSILDGRGAMPGWRNTLAREQLLRTVHYLRAMDLLHSYKTLSKPPPIPLKYLLFPESVGGQFIRDDLDR